MKEIRKIRWRLFWRRFKTSKVAIIFTVFGIIAISLFLVWLGVGLSTKKDGVYDWLWFTHNTYVLTVAIILGVGTLLLGVVGGYQYYYAKLKGK